MCLMQYANNKGADQPVHPRSLISIFVVRCLDGMTYTCCIQSFKVLASFWSCAHWFDLFVLSFKSQSTIFQSCRDGAIASWVINQYFRGVKCLAQGHNTAAVGLEPPTSRSGVRHSTTEPPRSPHTGLNLPCRKSLKIRFRVIWLIH